MALTASQIEQNFFRENSGLTGHHEIGDHMRAYFATVITWSKGDSLDTIYKKWLKFVITDNGGTVVSNYESDLLKAAVAAVGGVPANSKSNNKIALYQNL